jgi:hypothetical protein
MWISGFIKKFATVQTQTKKAKISFLSPLHSKRQSQDCLFAFLAEEI